ncbi:GIY-YIG nuclease family protein [Enterobacter cloacae]|uniref:GIY-YIG nuclease family protein n=1 Tax=Enterobacter cloacae TaxID=550 RepID=UPI0021088EF7|nr:GIY-YIG nuclease family protein [Enterobacter cloacae]MCQ4399818.1 GIY-YIG nuclease family protein [Enterobacter cloacae]HDC4282892.1 GIY-YIG nuclease family protein [Enterobacter cloacae]
MKEQFIYMCNVRNKHTKECSVKLGYTSNILERIKQLERSNIHYEYSDFRLFKHESKIIGYLFDEQRIHIRNRKYLAGISREVMPVGYTECYEWGYQYDLVNQLTYLGYSCVYDESTYQPPQTPMFQW